MTGEPPMRVIPFILIMLFIIPSVLASADFRVKIVGTQPAPELFKPGITPLIKVNVQNVGDKEGTFLVETGIYKKSTINRFVAPDDRFALAFFQALSFPVIGNCVNDQSFVQTRKVTLPASKSQDILFQMYVPNIESSPTDEFGILTEAFTSCYGSAGFKVIDQDTKAVIITKGGILEGPIGTGVKPATCIDSIKNGKETGIDCGGSDCVPCRLGDDCGVNADCTSGNCKSIENINICTVPTPEQYLPSGQKPSDTNPVVDPVVVITPPTSCKNGRVDSIETCLNCADDVGPCSPPFTGNEGVIKDNGSASSSLLSNIPLLLIILGLVVLIMKRK